MLYKLIDILVALFSKKKEEPNQPSQPNQPNQPSQPSVVGKILWASVSLLMLTSPKLISMVQDSEGFSSKPYKDSGNVVTIGYGTTKYPDGTKVSINDKVITKEQATEYVKAYLNDDGKKIVASLQKEDGSYVEMTQSMFDVVLDFSYNFGLANWNKSSMRKFFLAGEYEKACESFLKYKYVAGKDCSIRKNNCYGVWTRQLARRDTCISEIKHKPN